MAVRGHRRRAPGVIRQLLPPAVAAVETFHDPLPLDLLPEEVAHIAGAVDTRRREFATVRRCARDALLVLGVEPAPILPGPRGSPGWPAGIVGSMTHCSGYRAAAVARSDELVTIGVDAEPHEPLADEILEVVTVADERAALAQLTRRRPEINWGLIVFSAKESVYKAWFPLMLRWLDFDEAVVTIDPGAGTFTARLRVPGPVVEGTELRAFHGGWLVCRGLAITAIAVPTSQARAPSQRTLAAPADHTACEVRTR